jgi:hypothetical protein
MVQSFEVQQSGKARTVEVLHESGGTFLFRYPGGKPKLRSNSLQQGLNELAQEK